MDKQETHPPWWALSGACLFLGLCADSTDIVELKKMVINLFEIYNHFNG